MFNDSELAELAEMLCGRVDALNDILNSPALPDSTKRGIQKDILKLTSLDNKLRPYYKGE